MKGRPSMFTTHLLIFEAEHAVDLKGVFEFVQDKDCSGGAALEVREGMGTAYDEAQSRHMARIFPQVTFGNTTGEAHYRFKVNKGGHYTCWVRALWNWHCSNSIWVHPHGRLPMQVTDDVYDRWHWVKTPNRIRIPAGEYSFRIDNREDGVRFDQFCLALDAGYLPRGRMKSNSNLIAGPETSSLLMHAQMQTPLVFSNAPTSGQLWLRNDSAKPLSIVLSIESDPSISVEFSNNDSPVNLAPNARPRPLKFRVAEKAKMPLGKSQIQFIASWGETQKRQTNFVLHHAPDWNVAGPVSVGFSALQDVLDSTGKIPQPSGMEKMKWTKLTSPTQFGPSGRIDFARLFPGQVSCHAYARCEFQWSKDEEVSVRLRSDDQGTLWLNEEFVAAHTATGPADRYYSTTKMRFRKGTNHLLMRVDQKSAFWEAGIELKD